MATSGTIATTVFNTRKVVDQAYRRCRLPAQSITGEMIETALDELRSMLPAWLNSQLPLWCQTKYIMGLQEGVYGLELPAGVIDVLNANLRTVTRHTAGTQTSSTGVAANAFDDDFDTVCTLSGITDQNIAIRLTDAMSLTTAGILPGSSGTWGLSLQYSGDGATWTTFYSNTAEVMTNSEWLWVDAQGIPSVEYYRLVVATASLPVSIRELVFANNTSEINMAVLNRDDYFYLPNKNVKGRPVQYWLDKQRSNCVMNLWPAPAREFCYAQITLMAARLIQDVGTLQQELEVPTLWWDATISQLAARLAVITPEVKLDMIRITRETADQALRLAFAENRDRSPVYLNVDISPYTA